MSTINTFTSTGFKLIHHPEKIQLIKRERRILPISVQIAPTSRCNLNCVFCSNTNRSKHEDLDLHSLSLLLTRLSQLSCSTLEWTGGGDPTLYTPINDIIRTANMLGLKQGFISNGILIRTALSSSSFEILKWIRISMNCLDYVKSVDLNFPDFTGTLGFSYVWNSKTTKEIIIRLNEHVKRYKPKYVRIVPDCQATYEQQKENNIRLARMVGNWGKPYFYQAKEFNKSERCWWCYVKPFVLHDGWVYPCSSVVLNTTSNKTFHEKFRWCTIKEFPGMYERKAVPLPTMYCDHCVFKQQNDLIEEIINPSEEMGDFV